MSGEENQLPWWLGTLCYHNWRADILRKGGGVLWVDRLRNSPGSPVQWKVELNVLNIESKCHTAVM